jgi:mannose-6-phosphate isomerase
VKLSRKYVEKPWGRTSLPPMFDAPAGQRIGEVWFTGGTDLPLLAKYIFTSERLSIQVHPNDEQARARGLSSGKTECWYILDAEPDAVIGLGLTGQVSAEDLREAALDGSIERLIDWGPVKAGDFIVVPPGTIHAIGAGISLLEFQQNADVTYRLYDYGRPRELHLEDSVAVGQAAPFDERLIQHLAAGDQRTLVEGPPFQVVAGTGDAMTDRLRWIMPIHGRIRSGEDLAGAGDCLIVEPEEEVESEQAWMLIGASA